MSLRCSCQRWICLVVGIHLLLASAGAAVRPFADGERVVFLGDSITRAGGWHSMVALYYATRFPGQHHTWINAGISGDTAAGGLERLEWDVLSHKPNRVVVMFGMNEAGREDLPGEIGGEGRVALYREGMDTLLTKLKAAGVEVVLCSPSPYEANAKLDSPSRPEIDRALVGIVQAGRELADKHGVEFVDMYGPMRRIAEDFQKTNPAFTLIGKDRVHPGEIGHVIMASIFLKEQGVPDIVSGMVIDAANGHVATRNADVSDLKLEAGEVQFLLTEHALPLPFEGNARKALYLSPERELEKAMREMRNPVEAFLDDGWHFKPIEESLNRQMLQVVNLPEGEYELLIDDIPVGCWWHDELGRGINLAGLRSTPQYRKAAKVAQVHKKRYEAVGFGRDLAFTRLYILTPAKVDPEDDLAVRPVLDALINDPKSANNPALGAGGFAQGMASRYFDSRAKANDNAATLAASTGELYRLNTPGTHRYRLRPRSHPLTVDQRKAALDSRRSPEELKKTATDFLDLLVLDPAGLQRSNLRKRAEYMPVAGLAQAGKTVEALNAWRDYFFTKLRNPAKFGIRGSALEEFGRISTVAERTAAVVQAEELMQGKLKPGAVWMTPTRPGLGGGANPWRPALFQPLADAFVITGERRFLDKWIDYMDDWALHESADADADPMDLPDSTATYGAQIPQVLKTLASIARAPSGGDNFPPDTLARILAKLIRVYPTAALLYFESNPQNWTPHSMTGYMQSMLLLDEFKVAEYIFNRSRSRHENYPVTEGLPDGGEVEHALWYNRHVYSSGIEALDLAQAWRATPLWDRVTWAGPLADRAWDLRQRDILEDRASYLLQMLTPQSQNPLGNRNDQRLISGVKTGEEFDLYSKLPGLGRIVDTLRGNTDGGLPEFTMSAFPYSGSWLMRTGWLPQDGYAHFFSTPYPSGGHALPGLKGNNVFSNSLAGQDLLVPGNFGNYSYDRSPLRVDGSEQFHHAGIAHGSAYKSHKGFGVAYIDPPPAPWRSHSSAGFDFAEGIYEGPFGEFVDDHHDRCAYTAEFLAERARAVVAGVSHQRQVFFIKDPGLWIVVDRLKSDSPHRYSLDWHLPVAPIRQFEGKPASPYSGKTFTPETIRIDEGGDQAVVTTGDGMPNVSIRHFGPLMKFSTWRNDGEAIKDDFTLRYKLYDFYRVSGEWESPGSDLVVSLIEATPAGQASKVRSIKSTAGESGSRGFDLTLNDGRRIVFQSAPHGPVELVAPTLSVQAEALLWMQGVGGVVLGCDRFNGIVPQAKDFEYADATGSPLPVFSIHRPIAPVKIEPAGNLIDRATPIHLACETEEVEIRYTLDGSEPNLGSTLYREPFTIENSATVKARAFRKGLASLPENLAGTGATVTSSAFFTLQKPLEPEAPLADPKAKPGLKAEYAEGDWRDLVFFPGRVKPLKTHMVKNLFERAQPSAEKVFSWTYSGHLSVPEDGVYTFHAPRELILSKAEPGYSLRLFVGRETVNNRPAGSLNEWYPATTRHAYGTWSIALKKGLHPFKVVYCDYRRDAVERFNHPGLRENTIWDGATPLLEVSGPGLARQQIPAAWFYQR